MNNGEKNTLRAFLVAPLAAPAAYALGVLVVMFARAAFGSTGSNSTRGAADLVKGVAMVGVPIAYCAILLGGVPLYALLRHRGAVTRWNLWAGAATIGTVVALLLAPALKGDLFSIPFPWWVGTALGIVSAEAFWRLLRVRSDGAIPP